MRPAAAPGFGPPFERIGPPSALTPLVCAVPHAGRDYPPALHAVSAVPLATLEELEDRHADLLIADALAAGAVAIVARRARAWIDLNRGEEDLDPAQRPPAGGGGPDMAPASARARAGLGLLPSRVGRRDLWRVPADAADAAGRLHLVHRPYHLAIAAALDAARARHGFAILLDCHSMPPLGRRHGPARVVIGDRHGASAGGRVSAAAAAAVATAGLAVAHNAPYAGAYTLMRHGRPDGGVHALQIEIDRTLYLERDLRTPSPGVARVAALIAAIAQAAIRAAAPDGLALAAE